MVCPRCIKSIKEILKVLNIDFKSIELGRIEISKPLNEDSNEKFIQLLLANGFELLTDRDTQLINQVKSYIIEKVHHQQNSENVNLSDALSGLLHLDYSVISKTFSKVVGITVEHYYMNQRIEKTKELLCYEEMTISEIAFELGFSSVAHLSGQFKKITGMTPSAYKKRSDSPRNSIDDV